MDNEKGRRPELQPFAERIRKVRAELEMSSDEFGDSIGVGGGAVRMWEAAANSLNRNTLARMVDEHGVNPEWILMGMGGMWMSTTKGKTTTKLNAAHDEIETLPVYATETIEGGRFIKKQLLERIDTPSPLIGRAGAYGLFVCGSSMAPAFRYGDTAFVDPLLPPTDLTEVVLVRAEPHEGEEVKIICTLIDYDDNNWTVSTSASGLTTHRTKMSRAEWPKCHRIVGKFARR